MLAKLIDKAMDRAVYEIIEDEGTYWGEIPGFQGAWARQATLEGGRRELREALNDWIAVSLRLGLPIPVVASLDLNQSIKELVPHIGAFGRDMGVGQETSNGQ